MIKQETISLPTYGVGEPDKNPMFYEKRVYQGSSGKVYPLPVIDKIHDEKEDKDYNVVWLENEYIRVMVMPELGGRIQRAYDKTNDYDFVYYNQVIKPALVGLAGPWISGGIEFNWPQHHRPSTFSPVDYKIVENKDGSATIWLNEIDKMYGTKALMGFTLHPEKSYIEISGQLYNPTNIPQTFLWWANPAVAVNDYTQSIFPPDVHAVMDHGKRDVSEFPIAKGEYYKVDYSPGTDISRYKNIPVPTSYMAYHSDYNFVGGYDYNKEAGVLHVANHHISPGKKQWTWGHGEFGQAWDRHLTDEDGPYIELMTGVYTDNQPDFTWLMPGEEKHFKQYFMPYKQVGEVKNASIECLISLNVDEMIDFVVYTTEPKKNVKVILKNKKDVLFREFVKFIDPTTPKKFSVKNSNYNKYDIRLIVLDEKDQELMSYQEKEVTQLDVPEAAKASEKPENIDSLEELYLTGLHLEQYRHATYRPEDYYLEGLSRDAGDIRLNNSYGLLLYRSGLFVESEKYFRRAKDRLLWKNPNPYNGEVLYNLGLSLKMQGRMQEAFDVIYKSVWNDAMQNKGYYQLASISSIQKKYSEALELVNKSLEKNIYNLKSLTLKTRLLRLLNKKEQAIENVMFTLQHDILDYAAYYELYKLTNDSEHIEQLEKILNGNYNSYLELAIVYAESGFYEDGLEILNLCLKENVTDNYPMIYYYIGYFHYRLGNNSDSVKSYKFAEVADSALCFPNKLYSINVLYNAIKAVNGSKANYYLGNLFYDKKVYTEAIRLWENSATLDDSFPTVHRNLGIAYYNKRQDYSKAEIEYKKAYSLDTKDARVFYELDQLYKRTNKDHQFRLKLMEKNVDVLYERDDFYIEYVQVLNNLGEYKKALNLLLNRKFHVWEGGEGQVVEQYTFALKQLAIIKFKDELYDEAIELLEKAKVYPINLGEGKLMNAQENDINYLIGLCYESLGNPVSKSYYSKASIGTSVPAAAMFYNDAKPDSIFYQALAWRKLGNEKEFYKRINDLYDYGEINIDVEQEIDYFAISLPSFLIFEEDLQHRNYVHCKYLMTLGLIGKNSVTKAMKMLLNIEKSDKNHQGVISIKNFLEIY